MKLINLNRIASLFALAAFATATPRVNAAEIAKADQPHDFAVSAYASKTQDYNNFVWAYGDTRYDAGYACVSRDGVWAYGPMISQEFVSATEVRATYFDQATGVDFTLDLHTDGEAPRAEMAEAGVQMRATLIPVAPGTVYIQ